MALSPFTVVQDVAGPPAGQRVVDVGCGDGALVEALAKAGYDAEGVNPAPMLLRWRAVAHLISVFNNRVPSNFHWATVASMSWRWSIPSIMCRRL